jgi:hypothetical protein
MTNRTVIFLRLLTERLEHVFRKLHHAGLHFHRLAFSDLEVDPG